MIICPFLILMLITSPVNPQLKFARRVREGKEPTAMFVEGERLAEECLRSNKTLLAAFHTPEPGWRTGAVIHELQQRNCPVYETSAEAFEVVSDTVNSQGIIIIAERPQWDFEAIIKQQSNLLLALDAVQDPGNVGAIMRTAEAAGVQGIIALKGTVDCFAPKTLRSAMGSAFRLPIVTDIESAQLIEKCRALQITIAATAAEASLVYSDYDWSQPTMVILGNEARGISAEIMAVCDVRMQIPLSPPVESLNVAAAAAVILFEAARQRRIKLSL